MSDSTLVKGDRKTIDRQVFKALIIGELVFLEDPFVPPDTFWRTGEKVTVTPETFENLRTEADEVTYRKILKMTDGRV